MICPSLQPASRNFYPRPPRGGRPFIISLGVWPSRISIHALREEGDLQSGLFHVLVL